MLRSALCVLIACLAAAVVHGHVMGIDFGSEYLKIAAPHGDQSVEIVLNELSKRKTDTYMGFRGGERYVGDQAKSLAARFPLLTVTAVNQLMGVLTESKEAKAFSDMLYEYEVAYNKRKTAVIPIKDKHGPFTVEEIYSMFLSYAERISELDGVVMPQSAVITIPFHASVAVRRSILEAARLAEIDVLGFMHSTTAAALYYGMRHRGFGNRTVTMVVFDIGSTHTEVGVYKYTPPPAAKRNPIGEAFGTLSTLLVLEDSTLGGRALDLCVARVIEKNAMASLGVKSVLGGRSAPQLKSQFSLVRAANKAREVLSANTNTPLAVEGIAPERDFHSSIDRATYEDACAPIFERVKILASRVLTESGLKPSDVDAFELMGGAARTPHIIADLSSVLGREVDRTLNMDEAAAIGAAYYGVKLSRFYRAKSFRLNEQVPVNIHFSVDPALQKKRLAVHRRELFNSSDIVGSSVSVTLNRTDDFVLNLFEGAVGLKFAELHVKGVKDALDDLRFFKPLVPHANNTHLVRIQLRVNETGLVDIEEAEVIVRYAANVTQKVNVNETDKEGKTKTVSKTESTIKMRQASQKLKAHFTWFNPEGLSAADHEKSVKKLMEIEKEEQRKREVSEARNALEGYMFWIKGDGILFNDELVARIAPTMLEKLRSAANAAEEWLEEGRGSSDACSAEEYKAELAVLQKLVKEATGAPDSGNKETESTQLGGKTGGSAGEEVIKRGAHDEEDDANDNEDL